MMKGKRHSIHLVDQQGLRVEGIWEGNVICKTIRSMEGHLGGGSGCPCGGEYVSQRNALPDSITIEAAADTIADALERDLL